MEPLRRGQPPIRSDSDSTSVTSEKRTTSLQLPREGGWGREFTPPLSEKGWHWPTHFSPVFFIVVNIFHQILETEETSHLLDVVSVSHWHVCTYVLAGANMGSFDQFSMKLMVPSSKLKEYGNVVCNTLQHLATPCNTLQHHNITPSPHTYIPRILLDTTSLHMHVHACTYMYTYVRTYTAHGEQEAHATWSSWKWQDSLIPIPGGLHQSKPHPPTHTPPGFHQYNLEEDKICPNPYTRMTLNQ